MNRERETFLMSNIQNPNIWNLFDGADVHCEENDDIPENFFEKTKPHIFFYYIEKGLISPWVFYSTDKINTIVDKFDDTQTKIILKRINPSIWKKKLSLNKKEHDDLKNKLKSINL